MPCRGDALWRFGASEGDTEVIAVRVRLVDDAVRHRDECPSALRLRKAR